MAYYQTENRYHWSTRHSLFNIVICDSKENNIVIITANDDDNN